jgi:hypothetical protein
MSLQDAPGRSMAGKMSARGNHVTGGLANMAKLYSMSSAATETSLSITSPRKIKADCRGLVKANFSS